MLSKISFSALPWPLSVKMTALYVSILLCTLLFTSFLTVTGLYYIIYRQAENDIIFSKNNIIQHLQSGRQITPRIFRDVSGVILRITDSNNNVLVDSDPELPDNAEITHKLEKLPFFLESLSSSSLQILRLNHHFFYYATQLVNTDTETYQLHILKSMSEQEYFLKLLVKNLAITNFIGLLAAVVAGIIIGRRILRPLRDITTAVREMEINDLSKRIELHENNQDELQQLATTFNHMLNRIQSGFEQQRRFVADASHELRTPITVISGYANMLDRWGKQDKSVLTEGVEAIKSEAANMQNLIENLLFLARADQNKQIMQKKALSTRPLLTEILQETQLIDHEHHITLTHNEAAEIFADPAALKQMLRIFIENSIKYTPAGGKIILSACRGSKAQSANLEITVQDTGIGIPPEDQPKIFDRFYRVDPSRAKITGGSGLGLSIARWIAEQHQAKISICSTLGEGTTVTISLPLVTAATTANT